MLPQPISIIIIHHCCDKHCPSTPPFFNQIVFLSSVPHSITRQPVARARCRIADLARGTRPSVASFVSVVVHCAFPRSSPAAMSARKRARTSAPAQSFVTRQPHPGLTTPLAHGWHALLPELFQQAVAFVLGSRDASSALLLSRLSTVCASWRGIVFYEGSGGGRYVDLWAMVGTATIIRGDDEQDEFSVAGRPCDTRVVPSALTALRHVSSLSIRFGLHPPRSGLPVLIDPLQHYDRLVALDLSLQALLRVTRQETRETEAALNAALTAIADRRPNPLRSLALHCPTDVHPAVTVLRRLCASVRQLALSQHELLLMAWGSVTHCMLLWTAPSVQSFVMPPATPHDYISVPVARTLDLALPSLMDLRVEFRQERKVFGWLPNVWTWIGDRLRFVRLTAASLNDLPRVGQFCTRLVSLVMFYDGQFGLGTYQLRDLFATAMKLAALTELTVVGFERYWPAPGVQLVVPPHLRYLHLHLYRGMDQTGPPNAPNVELDVVLSPNLNHLALVVDKLQGHSLLQSVNTQHLPLLVRCHIGCVHPTAVQNGGWLEAMQPVKQLLSNAWCEKEDDVVRWRADRVWKRSVGLPDETEEYPA